MKLEIPEAGRWVISLEYDSRRPLHVSSPQLGLDDVDRGQPRLPRRDADVPGRRGRVDGPTDAEVTVEPERPNLIARVLRAPNEAHLRSLTATPLDHDATERVPGPADLRQVRGLVPARVTPNGRRGPVARPLQLPK